jgi:outer membrane protein assembly factor BamB
MGRVCVGGSSRTLFTLLGLLGVSLLFAGAPVYGQSKPIVRFHGAAKPLASGAVVEDWPGFLGARRDGVSRETMILDKWPAGGPRLVWEMEAGGSFSAPSIVDGRLVYMYRIGGDEVVDCVDSETGRFIWRQRYPCGYEDRYGFSNGPRASPVIDDGRVYTFGVEGVLHCLDLKSGKVIWRHDTSRLYNVPQNYFGVGSTPLVEGDLLIVHVGSPGGPCVVAYDKRTGDVRWKAGDRWAASYASPVRASFHGRRKILIFAGGDSRPPTGGLLVLDASDGRVDFRFPWRAEKYESVNAASPVVIGHDVFVTSSYGVGGALISAGADGTYKPKWTTKGLGSHWATPIHRDGYLYGFDGEGTNGSELVCIRLTDGKEMWREEITWKERVPKNGEMTEMTFSPMRGSLIYADGKFICVGEMGHLLLLDMTPSGVTVLDRSWPFAARETFTAPVLSHGLLYVCQSRKSFIGSDKARLLCFDVRGTGGAGGSVGTGGARGGE